MFLTMSVLLLIKVTSPKLSRITNNNLIRYPNRKVVHRRGKKRPDQAYMPRGAVAKSRPGSASV